MKYFRFQPTKTAEWQALVIQAETQAGYTFDESLECYLVLTLDHFTTNDALITSILAIDFLKAQTHSLQAASNQLRHVGDQCLLLAGLFPERAIKKNVSLEYFISIGKQAYRLVAHAPTGNIDSQLFYKLSDNFIGLMDVLFTMRHLREPH